MENRSTFVKAGVYLAYPLAYLYVWFFFFGIDSINNIGNAIAKTVFIVLFILWNEIVLRGMGKSRRLGKWDYFWYGALLLTGATMYIAPSYALSMFVIHIVVVYAVAVRSMGLYMGDTSAYLMLDLFNGFCIKPVTNFFKFFTDPGEATKDSEKAKTKGKVIIGVLAIVLIIPAFIVAIVFLCEMDESFNAFFNDFLLKLVTPNIIFETIAKLFLSIPVSLFFYGLASGYARTPLAQTKEEGEIIDSNFDKLRAAPVIISRIIISVFSVLYLVFFVLQFSYFFSAFSGSVENGFTIANYARRGFFELCGIMAVNLFVFAVMRFLTLKEEYDNKINKILMSVLMVESLVFATTSLSKLILYFSIYGYTAKRILAVWGTVFLGAGAVLVIMSMFAKKRNYIKVWVVITMGTFIVMCIMSGIFKLVFNPNRVTVMLDLKKDITKVELEFYSYGDNDVNTEVEVYDGSDGKSVGKNEKFYLEKPDDYSTYSVYVTDENGNRIFVYNFSEKYDCPVIEITEPNPSGHYERYDANLA